MIQLIEKDKAKTHAGLEQQLNELKERSAGSTDRYVTAIYVALSDAAVREKWTEKFVHGFVPDMVYFEETMIPEQVLVIFPFGCAPGTYCFLNPSFAVAVDVITPGVIRILDPYLTGPHAQTFGDGHMGWPTKSGFGNSNFGDGYSPWPGMGGFRAAGGADGHGPWPGMGGFRQEAVIPPTLDACPVHLEEVTVLKRSNGQFLITAKGSTSDGGWNSKLEPYIYIVEPEVWGIAAIATCPHGQMHNHMVSHWEASITMHLGVKTKKITVHGSNSITKEISH